MAEEKDSLLTRWKNLRNKTTNPETSQLTRLRPNQQRVLSTGQARLYFLQQIFGDNPFYHYADLYEFKGEVDVELLIEAFQQIVANHDILRTTFKTVDGIVQQIIHDDFPCALQVFPRDLSQSDLEKEARTFARIPFDLEEGPLVSLGIFPQSHGCSVLVSMHHIVIDKWSMNILRREWAAHYSDTYSEEMKGQFSYADFASWESARVRPPDVLNYWKSVLTGDLPVLDLPQDFLREQKPTYSGAFSKRAFSEEESKVISDAAASLDVTLFVYFLAAFKLVLYRYSNQKDIWVGTPFTNRSRESLEKIIGFFNDTLVLRSSIDQDQSVRDFIAEMRQTVLDAFANKDVTFEQVVNSLEIARDPWESPLFRTMFLFHEKDPFPTFSPEIEVSSEPFDLGVAKFDLTLYVERVAGNLTTYLEYATDLFESKTIERVQDHLHLVARELYQDPDRKISSVPYLLNEEIDIYSDWNRAGEDQTPIPNLIDHIRSVAKLHPKRPSIRHLDNSLTYAELLARSRMVAHGVQSQSSFKSGQFVGLLLEPDCAILPSIIGCMGSLCGYIPLDPKYPQERLKTMVSQAGVTTVIAKEEHLDLGGYLCSDVINYDGLDVNVQQELYSPLDGQQAYIIFTSGSTGQPKGVPVTYGNLAASTRARFDHYDEHPGTFLLMSSISFDSSVAGIFWTLWSGGTLVTKPDRIEQDVHALATLVANEDVTHTLMLPSIYSLLLRFARIEQLKSLKHIMVAGEACPPSLVEEHFSKLPLAKLHNEYGPTEATVWCSVHQAEEHDGRRNIVPIGRAISGYQLAVLNAERQQVPVGGKGELYIGGQGITHGYLNAQDETDKRFLRLDNIGDGFFYRSGDQVYYDDEGLIYFHGRVDHQIKIRGFRIEPNEVERILTTTAGVEQAVVLVVDPKANPRLVAFYLGPREETEVKEQLAKILPDYMVPNRIFKSEDLPTLPNGKVDRQSLLQLAKTATPAEQHSVMPDKVHSFEKDLQEVWQQVLDLDSVGRDQNYFELGGDSIKSIQIIARARERGLKIGPAMIFKYPTIAELALFTEPLTKEQKIYAASGGRARISPIQAWFFEQHQNAPHHWNQGHRVSLVDSLPTEDFYNCCLQLVNHHDALRSVFLMHGGTWEAEFKAKQRDLEGQWHVFNEQNWQDEVQNLQERLDLGRDPLIHFIIPPGNQVSSCTIIAHHLVIDAVSWQLLWVDLDKIMIQSREGRDLVLEPATMGVVEWSESLYTRASHLQAGERDYWQAQIAQELELPTAVKSPILEEEVDNKTLYFQGEMLEQLYSQALIPFGNQVRDLLVLAVCRSWKNWTGQSKCNLLLEGHGRDIEGLNVTRTVGWFTNFFPMLAEMPSDQVGDQLKYIKEIIAASRGIGWQYGALRYGEQSADLPGYLDSQIVVNYLGDSRGSTPQSFHNIDFLVDDMRHPHSERHFALELNIARVDLGLTVNLSYAEQLLDHGVTDFHADIVSELGKVVRFCLETEESAYTPSDFEEVDISQEELDNLLSSI